MAISISKLVYIGVALVLLFVLMGTIVLPQFAGTYEYGFGSEPCAKTGCTATSTASSFINSYCTTPTSTPVACSGCNGTAGYSTFLSTCGSLIAWNNNTNCNGCTAFGYKSTNQGLLLFILVIALIMFALLFIKGSSVTTRY